MSTATVQIACNTRPVRLAFILDKPEAATLERVFRLNSLLWGGMLNPIVVLDGTSRKQAGMHYKFGATPHDDELCPLLKDFDPDVLINFCSAALPASLERFRERTFSPAALRWDPWNHGETSFFLEVWPFLSEHWRREVRFLRKPEERYGYIDLEGSGELRTYLAARFGSYPDETKGNEFLGTHFAAKLVTYDRDFRRSFIPEDWTFPIRTTTLQLEPSFEGAISRNAFLLLDPLNMFDLIDFWNLRAAGCLVSPLPIGHYQDFEKSAKAFASWATYRRGGREADPLEIIKARSVEDSQHQEAWQWVHSLGVKADRITLRGWMPQFGERHAGIQPDIQVRPAVSKESTQIAVLNDGYGTLLAPQLDCELIGPSFGQHWATELRFFSASDEKHTFRIPWLSPECDKLANRKLGHDLGAASSRASKRGLVAIRRGDRDTISIQEPSVAEVVRAILRDGGFTYLQTSSPGLALERIIQQLGGLWGCGVLQNPGVREVIDELARGSPMHAETFRKTIYKTIAAENGETQKRFEGILNALVSSKVLRQGLCLQCDVCQRNDWYHLADLSDTFRCKKCFHDQAIPVLDKRPWHFVSDGLFRLEGKAAGCVAIALSLLFFRNLLHSDMKYLASFDYADGNARAERDYAVLTSDFFDDGVDVIFGECKTSKELEEKQKNDITRLADSTAAYLAFSTLSDEFTDNDKEFFRQLVAAGKKPILLARKHLEMDSLKLSEWQAQKYWGASNTEFASFLTIRDVLGEKFAQSHGFQI